MIKKVPAEIRKQNKESRHKKRYTYSSSVEEIPAIAIFTEGKNTEPIYFETIKKYADDYLNIKIIGCGRNTLSLVNNVDDYFSYIEEHNIFIEKKTNKTFKHVWCVFDRDDFKANFNNAIHKGLSKKYHIAFSNPCFELWFYLHKNYQSNKINRNKYEQDLASIFQIDYNKCKDSVKVFVEKLIQEHYPYSLDLLFNNAINLESNNKACSQCLPDVLNTCYECDPRTRVHYLVMLIMYKYLSDTKKNFIKNKYPELVSIIEKLIV